MAAKTKNEGSPGFDVGGQNVGQRLSHSKAGPPDSQITFCWTRVVDSLIRRAKGVGPRTGVAGRSLSPDRLQLATDFYRIVFALLLRMGSDSFQDPFLPSYCTR